MNKSGNFSAFVGAQHCPPPTTFLMNFLSISGNSKHVLFISKTPKNHVFLAKCHWLYGYILVPHGYIPVPHGYILVPSSETLQGLSHLIT
jgi:hypothetical protein